jgi:carbamoyl-phosphate synthase large subunit
MPKRTDIHSILIIGAGPIVIGQACEFDYSGAQACKALKAEGYRVILVNSNPATIMTDPGLADATYVEPITPEIVEKIIARERPDALLPTMGGQTALNTAMKLAGNGALERYGVELIGARAEVIERAEDRLKFRDAMAAIGIESPRSAIAHSIDEARAALADTGLPAVIRPSFTLGGTGGGIAYNKEEFEAIVAGGLEASPTTEVLIEESILGWKEYEMEVVRDRADNCIIVCAIENVDPMGVHTGDSVTVAPALTLTDKEYQRMRDASIACLRAIGVDTGGSNVQFGLNPADGRMVIIEMNPRVSRSSALASKATGFPIAKIAAKLAVGYTLDELTNDITQVTPASFEPAIDYVVVKIPRFTFEKFPGTPALLTTSMKSVGEAMAIGRSFAEALQKGFRSLETGLSGLDPVEPPGDGGPDAFRAALSQPRPDRLLIAAQAIRASLTIEDIHDCCKFDPWFLRELQRIVEAERVVAALGLPPEPGALRRLKALGFSDRRLAELTGAKETEVAARRQALGVVPVFKRIDTCAAEFASTTPYMYSTYEGGYGTPTCEADPTARQKIIILGGGPNRIGQGIEFDYCCVHAAYALKDAGFETIMVNCNPETVSTDYDTSDRLYFEPLTAEDVIALARREQENGTLLGCIVQYGGQTPLKLSLSLASAGIPILGTSPDAIDTAEDRERFQLLSRRLGLMQPENGIARSAEEAEAIAGRIGYPVVIRPSYVLGGRAMEIVYDRTGLHRYMREAVRVSGDNPVLIDQYLNDAIEVDVDCVCDGESVYVAGVMEHIEEAGIHSGDSACSLPPYSLSPAMITEQGRDRGDGPRARRHRPDECAIRDQGRHDLRAGGESSRLPYRAVRRQGDRRAGGEDRRPGNGGRDAGRVPPGRSVDRAARRGQGGGVSVRPVPQRGHDSWPGDEVDRRGHGRGHELRAGFRQIPVGRGRGAARRRLRLPLGQGRRQEGAAAAGAAIDRDGVLHPRHQGHGGAHPRGGVSREDRQQGAGGEAALRRRDSVGRGAIGDQHRLDAAVGCRQFRDQAFGADPFDSALHDHRRRTGRRARDRRDEIRNP